MRTKITSMKRAFILFWHGLTALLGWHCQLVYGDIGHEG